MFEGGARRYASFPLPLFAFHRYKVPGHVPCINLVS